MKLAACIVETRNIENFEQVIKRHLDFLPEDTNLYIFGSDRNDCIKTKFTNCRFVYCSVNSINDYSNLLKTKEFWQNFIEDRVLIFQHDSGLLRRGIEDFYEWDYIGSSWKFPPFVGNGGLSLRNPKAMINCILESESDIFSFIDDEIYEDLFFSQSLELSEYKIAPTEVADLFSIESKFILGSLGFHAIDRYLDKEKCDIIINQYTNNNT